MIQEHLNRPLCRVCEGCSTAVVKCRAKVTVTFTMHNGGGHKFATAKAIIIRRVDVERVHDYARAQCSLRDYLLIRLPMKIGLRSGEIATLRIENIDFNDKSFEVLDSKKHELFSLPLNGITLELIKDLIGPRTNGFVFRHKKAWKHKRKDQPLTTETIWHRVHRIGEEAGVKGFHPRILRHYFAAYWIYVDKKSTESLRWHLRHSNPVSYAAYLARLVFFEDMQREYQQTQSPYIKSQISSDRMELAPKEVSQFYEKWCAHCESESVCKFCDQVALSPWASGCRYYKQKKELILKE